MRCILFELNAQSDTMKQKGNKNNDVHEAQKKAARDNRANQMNPNNWKYYSSRGYRLDDGKEDDQ